jgi:uncharacterized protein (UPF0262 family)
MTGPHPDATGEPAGQPSDRIAKLTLDPNSIARGNANIEHEREVAIFDIIDANVFRIEGRDDGPYDVELGISEDRLVVTATPSAGGDKTTIAVAMPALRRVMKDYFLVCETYFQAIRTAPPSRIQQIDQGRRKLHDEGATALVDRLASKITMDNDTSRRLFTLVCALHWKG